MTAQEFVYWLQGYMEIAKPETLGKTEVAEIKNHLALVLTKVTPSVTSTRGLRDYIEGEFRGTKVYC